MLCGICGKEVVLYPSARVRALRYGGKASDYTKLFPNHVQCVLDKREAETLQLIRRNAHEQDRIRLRQQ